jgi:hypothetical protein
MDDEKKIIVYRGYVYEAGEKQLDEKQLRYVYQELSGSLKHLNNVLNNIRDQNTKRAISSIEHKIRSTFNDKIKNPDLYKSKSVEDMAETAKKVDSQMKQKQGISDFSHSDDATFEDKSDMNP